MLTRRAALAGSLAALASSSRALAGPSGGALQDRNWLYPVGAVMINTRGRTRVDIASALGAGTGIYIITGQSNAQNFSPTPYVPTHGSAIFDFNIYDGCLYQSAAPHLGCSGQIGDCWSWVFADKLITDGFHTKVILVHIAIGSSLFEDWTPPPALGSVFPYYNRIVATASRLSAAGITPTAILNEEGEANAQVGTSAANTTAAINRMVDGWRANNITCKFFQSLSTWLGSALPSNTAVRTGVGNSIDHSSPRKIWLGADTDTLNGTYRLAAPDEVHWNGWAGGSGMDAVSDLWKTIIEANIP